MTALRRLLPVIAVVVFATTTGLTLAVAGDTLGYDFQAYLGAAQRLLDGRPLYDTSVAVAGPFAIYLYPPPFALAFIPFAVLPETVALWGWTALGVACVVVAIAILPVTPGVRWLTLLLAGLDWPVLYSLKLGQVGPLLLLLFAAGWRWLDREVPLGTTIGLGTLVKVQPGLLILWSAMVGRWRATAAAVATLAVAALVSTLVLGWGVWGDYVRLLSQVSAPITTPHNMTPGAVLYRAGLDASLAGVVQVAWVVVSLVLAAFATVRRPAEVSYLVVVVASQAISPLLWDHYAMLLLLPVAWLLQQGHRWAVLVPLSTSVFLVGFTPDAIYPIVFAVCLLAPIALSRRADPVRLSALPSTSVVVA